MTIRCVVPRRARRLFLSILVIVLCAGCLGTASPAATTPSVATPVRLPSPGAASPGASPSPTGVDALTALAVADAARQAGVPEADVRVLSVQPREWPDRSLGCPQPGMGYAQAITPGYLITLDAAGRRFEYHTDQAQIVHCVTP